MRIRLATIAVGLLIAVSTVGLLAPFAGAQTPPSATTSLIVKVVPGLTTDQQVAIVDRNGGTLTSSIPALRLLVVSVASELADETLARYQADPQVANAEINKKRTSEAVPSDPLYSNQWALPKIGWDQVYGVITPTGSAKVAILDTGVDASHPELADKVLPGKSILDGSNGTTDPSGHGTWLAGIIAAQTDTVPMEGIAAVAPTGVKILPVTVLNANGEGQDSDVIAGVIWAADQGADVILMAFSAPEFSHNLQDAIDYAWSKGAVIVAAVGNNAVSTPSFPAGDRGVMGVAATDQFDALASFSNAGQTVFIAAPGVEIQTIDVNGAYIVLDGTSLAAAHVASLAAYMKAVDPSLTNGIIVGRIARNADPAGTQEETGNGRINMPRALADTSTEFVQPAGTAPVGDGGPFIGPYRAAANNVNVTLTSNQNPSNSGQSVTFTATVTCAAPIQGGTCTALNQPVSVGTVVFGENGNGTCGGNFAQLQPPQTPNVNGQVTFTTSALSVATHQIRVCYVGTGGSTGTGPGGATLNQVVNAAGFTVTFDAPTLNVADVADGTTILTVTIGANPAVIVLKSDLPKIFTNIASGTNVSYAYSSPVASTAATKRYRWNATSGTGSAAGANTQSGSFSITANSTVTAAYLAQFQVTFEQFGIAADTGSNTVVTVSGAAKTRGDLPFSTFVDINTGVTYAYETTVQTSPAIGKQYVLTTPVPSPASGAPITSAVTITGTYKTQFQVTFAQSGIDPDTGGNTIVTVDGVAKTRGDLPFSKFVDANTTAVNYTYETTVQTSPAGSKQYVLTAPTPTPASGFTVSAAVTVTGTYKVQYRVTFTQSGIANDTGANTVVTIDGVAKTAGALPFSTFVDAGTGVTYAFETTVQTSPASGKQYVLTTPAPAPASGDPINSPVTITGTYKIQYQVTFTQSGISNDTGANTVVTIDGVTKAAGNLSFSKFIDEGTAVNYTYETTVQTSPTSGKQYALTTPAATPASGFLVSGAVTITGTYKAQYQVTFTQSGIANDAGANTVVTIDGVTKAAGGLPFSKFVDEGTAVNYTYETTVQTSPASGKQYVLTTPAATPASGFLVSGAVTITGTYKVQFQVTLTQSGITGGDTGANTVVTIDGVTKAAGDLPFSKFVDQGAQVIYTFASPVQTSPASGKQYVLTTPAPSPASGFLVSGAVTITGTYKIQYQITFTQSGIGTDTGANTVLTIDGVTKAAGNLPFSKFVDQGAQVIYTFASPVQTSPAIGKQYVLTTPAPSPASGFLVNGAVTITGTYKTQYQVTVTQSGITLNTGNNTVVTVDGATKKKAELPFSKFVDENTAVSYAFATPISTDPVSAVQFELSGVTGPASGALVTGAVTITGNYSTATYSIHYLQPLTETTDGAMVNTGKNGRTVPVKILLYKNGVQLDPTTVPGDVTIRVVGAACSGNAAVDPIEEYADAGSSNNNTNLFRWATDGWIYNLDTTGLGLKVNFCYRLDVYIGGTGSIQASATTYALFKPTK